jgi:hypothetical protein
MLSRSQQTIRQAAYDMPIGSIGEKQQEEIMFQTLGSVSVEEHQAGDVTWIALRARGADWSWLTRDDALRVARHLIALYDRSVDSTFEASMSG